MNLTKLEKKIIEIGKRIDVLESERQRIMDMKNNDLKNLLITLEGDISKLQGEQNLYKQQLDFHSCFVAEIIGEILAKLISVFEGEEFAVRSPLLFKSLSSKYANGVADDQIQVIMPKIYNPCYYEPWEAAEITAFEEKGDMLILQKDNQGRGELGRNKNIKRFFGQYFNTGYNFSSNSLVDFSRFPYVEEFLRMLVDYANDNRIPLRDNKKKLEELLQTFIATKQEQILATRQARIKRKESIKISPEEAALDEKRFWLSITGHQFTNWKEGH